jgi:subtilisin family serine protease
VVALLANRLNDPNNHDNMIGIFLLSGMPGGRYIVRLTGEVVTNGKFHAWIERDNSFQSNFPAPNDNTHTIGSISCGKKVIAVGSYDANTSTKPLSYFSSAGPTRDGRKKPEISAPGHNVWAARSLTVTGVARMSGTSMAAPAVAGIIALMFQEAIARGIKLTIDQTIQILTDSARRSPPGGSAWNDRYGHGRISAAKAINAVIDMSSGGGSAATAKKASKPRKRKQ